MDLEQFYEADPRRRQSEEMEFGNEWTNGEGRFGVSWVEATGEVYVMAEPLGRLDDGGTFGVEWVEATPDAALEVEILGVVPGRDAIQSVMSGWQEAMEEDSIDWVRQRVANAAAELGDPPATPSRDLPAE